MAKVTSPCWGLPHAKDHPLLDQLREHRDDWRPTVEEIDALPDLNHVKSAVGVMMQWNPLPGRTDAETLEEWRAVLRRLLRRRRRGARPGRA